MQYNLFKRKQEKIKKYFIVKVFEKAYNINIISSNNNSFYNTKNNKRYYPCLQKQSGMPKSFPYLVIYLREREEYE